MHDLRYAFRLIRQNWAFSLTVIVILALAIGANTAVLSVVNAAMVRPLPYPDPDRLGAVLAMYPGGEKSFEHGVDGVSWELVRDRVPSLDVAMSGDGFGNGVNLGVNERGAFVHQARVSAWFFRVLGIAPLIGREFSAGEDREGGPPAVILSYAAWKKYFNGDRNIIGRGIHLRGEPYTVIGVMPAGFRFEEDADLWTALRPSKRGEGSGSNYAMIARLRPGATWEQARSQLALLTDDVRRMASFGKTSGVYLGLAGIQQAITQDLREPLMILWAAVAAVFVLGCVNIGGMLLARASGRIGEIATRLALGAPLTRIVRQLLTESIVLGLIGGAAGVLVGWAGLAALRALGADSFAFLNQVDFDWRVLLATLALTLLAGIGFGLVPAWQASRVDLRSAQSGSRTVAGRKRFVSLGTLVGGQVALTVPLLIGAGLLLHTFLYLWNMQPGFDPNHVLTARFSLQDARYGTSQEINRLFDHVIERLHETPGIEAAAVSLTLPYQRALNMGVQLPAATKYEVTNSVYVTPEYFAALRIPLLQGRVFTAGDNMNSAKVTIVNQAFANFYLKNQAVAGQVLRLGGNPIQIVGVVGNVQEKNAGWGDFGPIAQVPTVFVPAAQTGDEFFKLVHTWFPSNWIVRSPMPDHQVIAAIENATRSADPMLPISEFRSVNDLKAESLTFQRFLAALVNALAILAALLTTLGIYGLIANLVSERTKELGIRMALGSTTSGAIGIALKPALRWVLAGVIVGGAASFALERFLKSYLWGVPTADPVTLFGVAGSLLLATAVASLAPAARIVKLNPAETLRAE